MIESAEGEEISLTSNVIAGLYNHYHFLKTLQD
jgi:hypothetical protein